MEVQCSLDVRCAEQIAALLRPPSPQEIQDYFEHLLAARNCHGLKIKQSGEIGKGVYANMDFQEEDLVLKDQMLVGAQHFSNKAEAFVCSHCFCYIGSIELQIGRRLYLRSLKNQDTEDLKDHVHTSNQSKVLESNVADVHVQKSAGSSTGAIPEGMVEALMNGGLTLPYSKEFPLPPVFSCIGGCREEYYCSKSCAEADWESCHSLLCLGKESGGSGTCREALARFCEHATETNDIFLLAAKVISSTVLKYQNLKTANHECQKKKMKTSEISGPNFPFLLEAWKPFSMGYKQRWWDCVALPDDVECSEETSFRMQMKDLAFKSLQLLKAAIFTEECAPLFSLEIYGHIIGMFELNNLDLVVASPVEDYFIYISDLPPLEMEEADKFTRPLLDTLGDDYAVSCEGTAFFPIHSCMNHSCCPNTKAFKRDEDRDGQATIIALRPISRGEEVTISYIDEDLPYEDRQASLADYGFQCKCPKCLEE
ncbi:Histone-lysine N-methyltransferase [Nymphaea thermarum]|nr:Histone-lysine N-methyltransferase [Nymphaea thermarum]